MVAPLAQDDHDTWVLYYPPVALAFGDHEMEKRSMNRELVGLDNGGLARRLAFIACVILFPACSSTSTGPTGAGSLSGTQMGSVDVGASGGDRTDGSGGTTPGSAGSGGEGGISSNGESTSEGGSAGTGGGMSTGGNSTSNGDTMRTGGRGGKGGNAGTGGIAGTGGSTRNGGSGGRAACANSPAPQAITADVTIPPDSVSKSYKIASFRLWYPKGVDNVRGILVLVPGSNSDGRYDVGLSEWQEFATSEKFALMGCYFTDHQVVGDEVYAQANLGSGNATLGAISQFASQTGRCELENAPLLIWGFSAGGEFAYDFTCFRPDRVIAFVLNKGGYYHPIAGQNGETKVPALMFVGGLDEQWRIDNINKVFASGRTIGAPWALTVEKTQAHNVGDSVLLSLPFFHAILPLRLPSGDGPLLDINQSKGYIGNLDDLTISAATPVTPANLLSTDWLPDETTATLWKTVVNKK
jgi:hypothetical protein